MSVLHGIICIWSGAVVDIPEGWALCDGNNGTPDLRGLFVLGAGGVYNPGDIGGSSIHRHWVDGYTGVSWPYQAACRDNPVVNFSESDHIHDLSSYTNYYPTYPPFHALCYIMKV